MLIDPFFFLAKPLYPQEIVYINKRCCLGPLLSRDLMRSLPDAVRGSVVGPEKHNIMRLCMQHLVSASINPKQVLELFSREFYQSKKNRYRIASCSCLVCCTMCFTYLQCLRTTNYKKEILLVTEPHTSYIV